MSWQLVGEVLAGSPDVTYRQFRILVALAFDAKPGARVASPGVPALAAYANCRERTARTALAELQRRRLIRAVRHPGPGSNAAYELLPLAPSPAAMSAHVSPADMSAHDEASPAAMSAHDDTPAAIPAHDGTSPADIPAHVSRADVPAHDGGQRGPISPASPAGMSAHNLGFPTGINPAAPARPPAPAKAATRIDDQDSNDLARLVQAELFTATGRTIDADAAATLAANLLGTRQVRDPPAYLRRIIRDEPDPGRRFLPASARPHAAPPAWAAPSKYPPPEVAHRGAAAAKAALDAALGKTPEPAPPPPAPRLDAEGEAALARARERIAASNGPPRDTPGDELPPF